MASPTAHAGADVPLNGGYTRFELELEVGAGRGPTSRPLYCFTGTLTRA
jgi:hypothetical protein